MSTSSTLPFYTPSQLHALMGDGEPLRVFDVRRHEAFVGNPTMIKGSERLDPSALPARLAELRSNQTSRHRLVMVCVYGHLVSQTATAIAHCHGWDAVYLAGGLEAWCLHKLPVVQAEMKGS